VRDGSEFVSRRWLVAMVISFGLFQLTVFPALLVLGPTVAKHELGGPKAWGTALAVEGVGALLGGVVALRVRFRRPLVASLLLTVPTPVLLLAWGLVAPLWVISCVALVHGACLSLGGAVWLIGPLAGLVGVATALYLAAAVNVAGTLAVLTVPTVRGLRSGQPVEQPTG
jgi:hypothetical protein